MLYKTGKVAVVLALIFTGALHSADRAEIKKEYDVSISYYEKIKTSGANANELSSVLDRIILKYEPHGLDLTKVREEKQRVEMLRQKLPAQSLIPDQIEGAMGSDYKIDVGDMIAISVFPATELSQNVVVQADGKIVMPIIGEVLARNHTKDSLRDDLTRRLRVYVASPEVSISIRASSRRNIFLMGEVRRPGSFDYQENIGLMDFVSKNGGFSDKADLRNIKVYRGEGINRKVFQLNLDEVYRSGDFSRDFILQPGDVVEVDKSDRDIYIMGEVRKPGSYQHKADLRLMELITISGGFTSDALTTKVKVFRGATPKIKVFEVDMDKVLNNNRFDLDIKLEPGDTVYVQKLGFAKTTTFINRLSPWITMLSFGVMIAILIAG